tara:strand:- start:2147 stop:2710 length:564 start_codon:yes stop_codon:yes gene_type:complete
MANFIFDTFKKLMVEQTAAGLYNLETNGTGQISLETNDDLCVVLTTGACTAATCGAYDDLAALDGAVGSAYTEYSGTNYATGGKVVPNCSWEKSSGTGYTGAGSFAYLKGDNITWSALGAATEAPILGAVLYYCADGLDAHAHSDQDLTVAYFDFIAQPDASDLVLQWGSAGGASCSGDQGVILKLG